MAVHALFPGTFDPPTLGHIDLVERGLHLFGRVTVALAEHPTKQALFSVQERIELLRRCTASLDGVQVEAFDGLVVHAAARLGCDVILRGVRGATDYEYEAQMAGTNRSLSADLDTCLLPTRPKLAHITSTLVRQIAQMGGPVEAFTPAPVAQALRARFPLRET